MSLIYDGLPDEPVQFRHGFVDYDIDDKERRLTIDGRPPKGRVNADKKIPPSIPDFVSQNKPIVRGPNGYHSPGVIQQSSTSDVLAKELGFRYLPSQYVEAEKPAQVPQVRINHASDNGVLAKVDGSEFEVPSQEEIRKPLSTATIDVRVPSDETRVIPAEKSATNTEREVPTTKIESFQVTPTVIIKKQRGC